MRVCVVSPSFYPAMVYGGTIVSAYQTYSELARQGLEIFVSTTNANGTSKLDVVPQCFQKLEDRFFVKYYDDTVIGRFSWRFVTLVWRDIKVCDLVRVEDIFSTYIPPSLLYAKMFGKPTMISARGVLSRWALTNKRSFLKRAWLEILIRPFTRDLWWHATSEREKEEILQFDGKANVVVIPNGIDMRAFEQVHRLSRSAYMAKYAGVQSSPKAIIVSMGRLHRVKGFDVLLDAFSGLLRDRVDCVLLIAGADDGEQGLLEAQIARLGLEGKAFLTGEVASDDKVEFLSGGDVFALPSHTENFGNVYLEALAAGVPVVASRGTPWQEVERVGCGKWVENSATATEGAIRELLDADRAVMGERARAYARQFGWDKIAKRFQAVFSAMIENDGDL